MTHRIRASLAALLIACVSPAARAQSITIDPQSPLAAEPITTPDTPDPARTDVSALYDQFRDLKSKLPFRLGAGFWVYYWQPLSHDATLSGGSLNGFMEIWALHLELEKEHSFGNGQELGARIELRFRDGSRVGDSSASFGAASVGNVWFQEVFAYWKPVEQFKLKLGKMYSRMGLSWDNSFFGNLLYYDGILLNPDWGLGAEGTFATKGGKLALTYSLQFFVNSDGVQGGYIYGRTVGLGPSALPPSMDIRPTIRVYSPSPESEVDTERNQLSTINNRFLARAVLVVRPLDTFGIALGGSAEKGEITRYSEKNYIDDSSVSFKRAEGDLTMYAGRPEKGNFNLIAEVLRQWGPGLRDALYLMGGFKVGYNWFGFHVDASYVDYYLNPDVKELMITAGVSARLQGGFALYLDIDEWHREDPRLEVNNWSLYDRSLMFAVDYVY